MLHHNDATLTLPIPSELQPSPDRQLPELHPDTILTLAALGWKKVGIMVGFVDPNGDILMMQHHASDKNHPNALGPMGETSQHSGHLTVIEQPLETLLRGMREELSQTSPEGLEMQLPASQGWIINQWPRGRNYPGHFSCAVSFPVFVNDNTKAELLRPSLTHETGATSFMSPEDILATDDSLLRGGVKSWLGQMTAAGLLDLPSEQKIPVSFDNFYQASLHDIDLESYA